MLTQRTQNGRYFTWYGENLNSPIPARIQRCGKFLFCSPLALYLTTNLCYKIAPLGISSRNSFAHWLHAHHPNIVPILDVFHCKCARRDQIVASKRPYVGFEGPTIVYLGRSSKDNDKLSEISCCGNCDHGPNSVD